MALIQPIMKNSSVKQIFSISKSTKLLTENSEKIKNAVKNVSSREILPLVALPLVAYVTSKTTQNNLAKNLAQEAAKKSQNHEAAHPVLNRYNKNTALLEKAGIKKSETYKYLKSDGSMSDEGKNICKKNNVSLRGNDPTKYPSADLDDGGEYVGDMPSVYDDSADLKELELLDKAMDDIDKILDNPLLLAAGTAVLAEITPLVRFFKPAIDLANGDYEKACVGAISRGVDIVLALPKLFLAGSQALVWGTLGLAMNDKDFGFVKGFKEFYNNWAKGRDELEDEFLGRETKEQKLNRLRKMKENLEEERKKKLEEIKHKKLLIKQQELDTQKEVLKKQKHEDEMQEKQIALLIASQKDPHYKQNLNNARVEFELLLKEYQKLKPHADVSKYAKWESWDLEKLEKNIRFLRNYAYVSHKQVREAALSPEREKEMNIKSLEKYRKQCDAFLRLLNEYKALKPNANLLNYENWQNWGPMQMQKNMDILRQKISKIKNK